MTIKAVILMADYGNDPTEVANPWHVFKEAGWDVSFATENGAIAGCDKKMYEGLTQKLLGAQQQAVQQHAQMRKEPAYQNPISWSSADFSLKTFDLVFLPGGHDKGMKQYIESKKLHQLLAEYVPLTSRKDSSNKHLAAICHGVQVLAASDKDDGTSNCVIHDFETTALPGPMEQGIFYATAPFLGSYYKTYGVGSPSVEQIVRNRLDDPAKQYKTSLSTTPFTHTDPNYRYLSGRFPPDAQLLAERVVNMVNDSVTK